MAYRAPPPFAGAVPPNPHNVDPRQWNAGNWQYNPSYDRNGAQGQWAAAGAFLGPDGKPVQATVQNPFQIQAKPPSAEYLSMKVSDNALGLGGMLREQKDNGTPKTPWIWHPRTLAAEPEGDKVMPIKVPLTMIQQFLTEDKMLRAKASAPPPIPQPAPPRKPPPPESALRQNSLSRRETAPEPFDSRSRAPPVAQQQQHQQQHQQQQPWARQGEPLRTTFSSSIMRTPQMYQNRQVAEATRSESRASNGSSSRSRDPSSPDMDVSRQSHSRQPSYSQSNQPFSAEPSAELSPLIPDANLSLPNHRPRKARGVVRATTDPALSAIPEDQQYSSRKYQQAGQGPVRVCDLPLRQHSAGPEPQRRTSSSSRTRDYREPDDAAMDIEESYLDGQNRKRERSGGGGSSSRSSSRAAGRALCADDAGRTDWLQRAVYEVIIHDPLDRDPRGSLLACSVMAPDDPDMLIAASPGKTRVGLPLTKLIEGYPTERHYRMDVPIPPGGHVIIGGERYEADPHAGMEERPPVQREAPPRFVQKVRQGYWNRRGDHRTPGGALVLAPRGLQYPAELAHFPETEFYDEKTRQTRTIDPNYNKELSSSKPKKGQPPRFPYEKWVVYTWIV